MANADRESRWTSELAVTASDGQTGVVTVRLRTGDHAPVTTFQQGQHVFAIAALSGAGRR
jgi:hypothetical protein